MISAWTMTDGLNKERMLRLINQRQEFLPQDVLETSVSFIDTRCDAQIWFESFKDPNERLTLFNATTWDQLYVECQGSNENIKHRVKIPSVFYIGFDEFESSEKIKVVNQQNSLNVIESFDLNDLKQLRSLHFLHLNSLSIRDQTVPDFNGWSDELRRVDLYNCNFIGSISFTGFPKKLQSINLSNNPQLNGDITLPQGDIATDIVELRFDNNPNFNINTQNEAIFARIKYHGTPHYNIGIKVINDWDSSNIKCLVFQPHQRRDIKSNSCHISLFIYIDHYNYSFFMFI